MMGDVFSFVCYEFICKVYINYCDLGENERIWILVEFFNGLIGY